MMNWENVEAYLKSNLIPLTRKKWRAKRWLRKLPYDRDRSGELLGINMAIDIASEAILPGVFASIIDRITVPIWSARTAFFRAQVNHPDSDSFVCASQLNSPTLADSNAYLRVLEIEDFAEYYTGPSFVFLPHSPIDIKEVRKRYFSTKTSLAAIDKWWDGSFGRVWVMSKQEFSSVCAKFPKAEHGTILNDALGIGHSHGGGPKGEPEMVAVEYPTNFNVGCKQPTLLDSKWRNKSTWYVSEGNKDGWGTTQSCSGLRDGIRERVHSRFKNLTDEYYTIHIGPADTPGMDVSALISEAYRRFEIVTT
jgi:hypothetical protein